MSMDIMKIKITSTVTLYGETEQDRPGLPPSKSPWKKSFQVGTEVDTHNDLNDETHLADILPMISRSIHLELAKIKEVKPFFVEVKSEVAKGEPLHDQIDRLAKFIMAEVPGEPSASEGAIDTAIRIIKSLQERSGTGSDKPDPNVKAPEPVKIQTGLGT